MVGRVCPRHRQRGRPLNSVVIRPQGLGKMHSILCGNRAVYRQQFSSIEGRDRLTGLSITASAGWGGSVVRSVASGERPARAASRINAVTIIVPEPASTYNFQFERTVVHRFGDGDCSGRILRPCAP
jgi:hypothetical protein